MLHGLSGNLQQLFDSEDSDSPRSHSASQHRHLHLLFLMFITVELLLVTSLSSVKMHTEARTSEHF